MCILSFYSSSLILLLLYSDKFLCPTYSVLLVPIVVLYTMLFCKNLKFTANEKLSLYSISSPSLFLLSFFLVCVTIVLSLPMPLIVINCNLSPCTHTHKPWERLKQNEDIINTEWYVSLSCVCSLLVKVYGTFLRHAGGPLRWEGQIFIWIQNILNTVWVYQSGCSQNAGTFTQYMGSPTSTILYNSVRKGDY